MIRHDPEGRRSFILANTRLQPPPHTPELTLHLADEITPIWRMTEEALEEIGLPPPFWAFAWAGGQALARYILDAPETVAGLRVIDFASGSGIVAIAAARAGASSVLAADIDGFCGAALALNAEANGVAADFTDQDLLDHPPPRPTSSSPGTSATKSPSPPGSWPGSGRAYGRAPGCSSAIPGDPISHGRAWSGWRSTRCPPPANSRTWRSSGRPSGHCLRPDLG